MNTTCENCWFAEKLNNTLVSCQRNPPILFAKNEMGTWPVINKSSWCGEHVLEEPTTAVPPDDSSIFTS